MDILNGAVVEERSKAACGSLSCSGHKDAVFLHFFLDVYGGDSNNRVWNDIKKCTVRRSIHFFNPW